MENSNFKDSNQIINTNIINSLNNLYDSNGRNKQAWEDLLISLYQTNTYLGVIYFFNQKIINCPANPITLDIIDFLIDYGSLNLIREISKIEFMKNVFNLLKRSSGSSPDVQKKGIYLTKKWSEKNNEYPNENFMGFAHNFVELNNMGITLPPQGFKMYTYEQYITQYEANIMKSKAENNPNIMNNNYNNNNFNNNFNNNIYNNNNYLNNNNYNNNYNNNFESQPNLDNFFNKVQSMNSNISHNNMNNEENNENFSAFENYDNRENPFNELNDKNKVKFPENFQHDFSDFKSSENINNPNSENNKINNNKSNDLYCAPNISSFQASLNSKSNNQNNIYNNEFKNNFNNNNNNNDYNYSLNYHNESRNNEDKNYNNNKNNNKENNKYIKGMEKVGGMMKKGIFSMGNAVKNSTIKGYKFIRNKVDNKDKEEDIHNEVWEDYMDNLDSNSNYNQNNFNYNNYNYKNYNQGNNNNYNNNYNQGNYYNNNCNNNGY